MIIPLPHSRWIFLLALLFASGPLRAQITENPDTLDPGRMLLRIDALSLKREKDAHLPVGTRVSILAVGSTFLTAGITENFDFQVGADLFVRERVNEGNRFETHSGIGNVYLRPKWRFWADTGVQGMAAVMPYVKLPAGSRNIGNGHTEGGVIVPWSQLLDLGLKAGAMAQWDFARNDDDTGYDSRWSATVLLEGDLTRLVTFYAEGSFSITSASLSRTTLNLGAGAALQMTERVTVDAAVYAGATRTATDWNPVVRVRWRL